TDEDFQIIDLIKSRRSIVLLNKKDLDKKVTKEDIEKLLKEKTIIDTSIIQDIGIDILEESIKDMFYSGKINIESDIIVTNIRHKDLLEKASKDIESAREDLAAGIPLDCIEVDLRNCWENLGGISGDTIDEDILDKIFSEFCIGK